MSSSANAGQNRPTVALPGGTFRMVTDYRDAFSADGEGPVRTVTLSPFHVDTYPVTNRDFAAFVEATGYRTDAERFEWSFVFWMHLPPDRLDELIEDTVAAAPWWCKVPGSSWQHVMPRTATVTAWPHVSPTPSTAPPPTSAFAVSEL